MSRAETRRRREFNEEKQIFQEAALYKLTQGKEAHILYLGNQCKEVVHMPKVSSKRQITLPADQCRQARIEPGDEYDSYVDNHGHITIVKKLPGVSRGMLKGLKADKRLSDEASLQSAIDS